MTEKELKELCDNFDPEDALQFQKILLGFSKFDEFDGFADGLHDEFGVGPLSPGRWARGICRPDPIYRKKYVSIILDLLNEK